VSATQTLTGRAVTPDDLRFMDAALALAFARLGQTAPNPSVGCVIVRERRVIGAAATAAGGRPHAETQALAQAGEAARGARAYVSLEPCAHHGRTPPCAQALIDAGKKVIRYPIIGYWIDIGKPEDYQKVQEIAKHISYGN